MSTLADRFAGRLAQVVRPAPRWGVIEARSPSRYGWHSVHISIFPTGTTPQERNALWIDRNIATIVAYLVMVAMLLAIPFVPPLALLLGIPAGCAVIAAVRKKTRRLREGTLELLVSSMDVGGAVESMGDKALADYVVSAFADLDRRHDLGEINEVEYQRHWDDIRDHVRMALA